MQSENDPTPPNLPPAAADEDADSAARAPKRQRQSSPPPLESLGPDPTTASDTARGRPTLEHPPTIRGSSRDTNEMHRSSPEASGSIKYTRTGRVSKATKGQRVHHCEECGKTYTRAEHLRRHQQNHKPGAFPCDFPGCSRSFYREDLLIRHKARHNDPHNPPSRRHSIGSQSSAPDPGGLASASASTPGLSQPPTSEPANLAPELQHMTSDSDPQQSNAPSRAPKRIPVPPNELPLGRFPLAVENGGAASFQNPWNPSSPLRSPATYDFGYESPDELSGTPYFQHNSARARYLSDASYLTYGQTTARTSLSPVSACSSNLYIPQWPYETAPSNVLGAYQSVCVLGNQQYISAIPYGLPGALSAETRDYMEADQLDVLSISDYSRYVDAYWASVHEIYPIIHKPTYDNATPSPLLRAAILALGGQAVGDRADLSTARILHEKCLKVLKKRNLLGSNTYRVCDMQAVVLVEIYAMFKSRRPPLQLSENFELVYGSLSNDPDASVATPPASHGDEDSIEGAVHLNIICKQRLWLACYALEQHHNLLFGRTSSIGFAGVNSILPFPSSQVRWDAGLDFGTRTSSGPHFERISDALKAVSYMTEAPAQPYDAFQSMLMLVCVCDTSNDTLDWADFQEEYSLLRATERSARTRLEFHTLGLCKNTPLRQLLAVAGESWVMAEKLTTQAEYISAQHEVRHWAAKASPSNASGLNSSRETISLAMQHALSILKIHQDTPRTGLLFQEWAVYLAAVVIWAYAYVLHRGDRRSRLAIDVATEERPSPNELERSITALASTGPTAVRGWTQARNVLIWAKMRIEQVDVPHTCGLVSGALDVLSKLVARGEEDDWF